MVVKRRRSRHKGDFVRHRRLRLSFINLNSLQPIFEFSARRSRFIWLAVIFFIATGIFWLLLLGFTPLGAILPGRMPNELRDKYVHLAVRLDSISAASTINNRYTDNIRAILEGPSDTTATPQIQPQIQEIPLDSLMQASDAEKRFVNSYDDTERFNLSVLSPIAAEGMPFYPPVPSALDVSVNIAPGDIPAATISVGKATPISAVYRGTVLSTYYTTGRGLTVVVQHPNDFISVHTGLSDLFVKRGDKVNAGTRLGLASSDRYPLTFELWHNGSPLDPTDYITFTH